MKHDYTAKEILHAWNNRKYLPGQMVKTLDNLKAFLEALPTRSAQPERPQTDEIAALKAERDKWEEDALRYCKNAEFWQTERDKTLVEIAEYKVRVNQLHDTISNLKAELAALRQPILADDGRSLVDVYHKAWTEAREKGAPAALCITAAVQAVADVVLAQTAMCQSTQSAQPILADDGRSLVDIYGDAFDVARVQRQLPMKECCDYGFKTVAAVVLAKAVRRMEEVTHGELCSTYEANSLSAYEGISAVRARLIAAAKGEGQAQVKAEPVKILGQHGPKGSPALCGPSAQAVVVNEPPQDERQPNLSGESEKQDPYAWLKAYAKAGARIRTHDMEWARDANWTWCLRPESYGVHPDDLHMCPEYAPQAEAKAEPEPAQPCVCGSPTTTGTVHRSDGPCYQTEAQAWTPTVGQTVRLKSGGPVMTVTDVDPLSLMCAWMNASNELQVEPITTLCLTPVPNP